MQGACTVGVTTYMRIVRKKGAPVPQLNRRTLLASAVAAGAVRTVPMLSKPPARRILTLVYDKSVGAMRAIDRVVP